MKEESKVRLLALKNGLKDMIIVSSNRVYSEETSRYDQQESDLVSKIA